MKRKFLLNLITIALIQIGCSSELEELGSENASPMLTDSIYKQAFQNLIDSAKVIGSILIFDEQENTYFSNNFDWAKKGQLPASTFKIPNSIIALELGIVKDSSSILPWDGEPQMNPNWEQDLKLKDALQMSCVPCYRAIARQIGVDSMNKFVKAFNYGTMVIDSSNLDLFWLIGESRINSFEQINFLQHFNQQKLNIKPETFMTMRYILAREETNKYNLFGKTGWSNDNNHDNTWFVGFLEIANKVYYFATNLEPNHETNMNELAHNRVRLTMEAFKLLNTDLKEN
ncbi:MAG: penicillin-binding transpeptidase domain-containing protein [Crocinitomicaceae bacterium]